jgi:predicted  nucleic acid-binding Zn-ribbon protein
MGIESIHTISYIVFMLTKSDLDQIRGVVQEELKPVKADIGILKSDVGTLRKDVGALKKDVSTVKQDVAMIRKDMKTITNFFDREYLELRKRVERIEEHLSLEAASA